MKHKYSKKTRANVNNWGLGRSPQDSKRKTGSCGAHTYKPKKQTTPHLTLGKKNLKRGGDGSGYSLEAERVLSTHEVLGSILSIPSKKKKIISKVKRQTRKNICNTNKRI